MCYGNVKNFMSNNKIHRVYIKYVQSKAGVGKTSRTNITESVPIAEKICESVPKAEKV